MSRNVPVFYIDGVQLPLSPTFSALVAAEAELGSLFELVERSANGELTLVETAALFDHLSRTKEHSYSREQIGEKLTSMGLSKVAPILRSVLSLILQGSDNGETPNLGSTPETDQQQGASLRDRAGRPPDQDAQRLGDTATIPSAGEKQ